jgi:predicted secreted protein
MTKAEAENRTRQIFDSVEYDRQVRKVKSTVEDYLTAEINNRIF